MCFNYKGECFLYKLIYVFLIILFNFQMSSPAKPSMKIKRILNSSDNSSDNKKHKKTDEKVERVEVPVETIKKYDNYGPAMESRPHLTGRHQKYKSHKLLEDERLKNEGLLETARTEKLLTGKLCYLILFIFFLNILVY